MSLALVQCHLKHHHLAEAHNWMFASVASYKFIGGPPVAVHLVLVKDFSCPNHHPVHDRVIGWHPLLNALLHMALDRSELPLPGPHG